MNDTIAAISTSLGGAISIIRMSGYKSLDIANSIFEGSNLKEEKTHTIHYGFIKSDNEIIDEVLVSIMKAPKTFTTEDIVEINCHGGVSTTNKILELLLLKGARLAEPGEFTKRAFINGRIDLVEAESVMNLINSKTEKSRKLSINQLKGNLSNLIKNFRQELLELLASIEVNIDYPEYEDMEEITQESIKTQMNNIKNKLSTIVEEAEHGKIINEGINVTIIGRPNVGKSSILNSLLGEEKAIVTDVQGTTRDIVEGKINIDGILLNIIDTAGIRKTNDVVEKIGVEKSLNKIKSSDLVLLVLNNNEPLTIEDRQLLKIVKEYTHIIVINKTDLTTKLDISEIDDNNIININTIEQNGINSLKEKIKQLFKLDQINEGDYTYLSNSRQISLAKEAYNLILDVEDGLKNNLPVDIIEIDIKQIWTKLGEIIGDTYSEELIDQLFSQFCLGK